MHGRGLPGPMHESVDTIHEQKTKNNENHDKTLFPTKPPIGGPSRPSPAGGVISSCRGLWVMGLGPSGKAMAGNVVAAPAPGSLNNTNSIKGAEGGGCPSPDKAHAPEGKGVNRFFCDVHRRAKNGEGYRITFTTDGVTFKHVDGFAEIPVKAGDKVFADVVPLQHTDGVVELLRRGVELYYLRRLTLIKERREELKLPKTTRGKSGH